MNVKRVTRVVSVVAGGQAVVPAARGAGGEGGEGVVQEPDLGKGCCCL